MKNEKAMNYMIADALKRVGRRGDISPSRDCIRKMNQFPQNKLSNATFSKSFPHNIISPIYILSTSKWETFANFVKQSLKKTIPIGIARTTKLFKMRTTTVSIFMC